MEKLEYKLVRSQRRSLSARVTTDGVLEVRAPLYLPLREIEAFLEEHRPILQKRLAEMRAIQPERKMTPEELQALAEEACKWFPPVVAEWSRKMGVSCRHITIRNQKTKWGSCSSRQNLNFNCLLMLAPEWVRQYVVVHELCHLTEMNHSPAFWQRVAQFMPNYKEAEAWLKTQGARLMAQM